MHERIQKWLQVAIFGLLMLVVGSQFDHQAKTLNKTTNASDWYVANTAGMDRYVTDGQQIRGHYIGAVNLKGQCEQDILLLSLSSYDDRIHQYEGSDVLMKVTIGDHSEVIELPVLGTVDSGFGPQLVLMSNFVMSDSMRQDMRTAEQMSVEVLQPEAMADLLTVSKETFSLRGFDSARIQSQHNCRLI